MNPQQPTPSDPFTEPTTTPSAIEQPTEPVTPPVVTAPKKSHKRAVVLLIIGLVLIIGAIAGYAYYMQATTPASDVTTESAASPVEETSPVDSTTDVLIDGLTEENTASETHDTSELNDADKAADTVGESVNENNL